MKKKPFGYATGDYFFMKFLVSQWGLVSQGSIVIRYPLSVNRKTLEIRSWTLDIRHSTFQNLKQLYTLKAIGQFSVDNIEVITTEDIDRTYGSQVWYGVFRPRTEVRGDNIGSRLRAFAVAVALK